LVRKQDKMTLEIRTVTLNLSPIMLKGFIILLAISFTVAQLIKVYSLLIS
jgi:hypothetical protein